MRRGRHEGRRRCLGGRSVSWTPVTTGGTGRMGAGRRNEKCRRREEGARPGASPHFPPSECRVDVCVCVCVCVCSVFVCSVFVWCGPMKSCKETAERGKETPETRPNCWRCSEGASTGKRRLGSGGTAAPRAAAPASLFSNQMPVETRRLSWAPVRPNSHGVPS